MTALLDRLTVPGDTSFGDNDFQEAPDLQALASQLLTKHDISFRHIRALRIAFLWKRKGGKKGEKGIWGKVSPVSGVAQYWGGVDYVVWLAADHCRKNHLEAKQVEALLYHELCHFGQDPDTGEVKMVGHDAEVFAAEIREYGLWTVDLEVTADAFRQLPLTPFEE